MADLSQTAASVVQVATGSNPAKAPLIGTAGATITAGKPVYLDTAENKWKLADNNVSALLAGSAGLGIALCGASDGQPIAVHQGGDINIGATLTVGETYLVSATAGAIAPIADISTNYVSVLGVAISASVLRMPQSGPIVTGIQHA